MKKNPNMIIAVQRNAHIYNYENEESVVQLDNYARSR